MTLERKKAFVTVYKPFAGWKAVHYWWNPDGFYEPWETSNMAFATESEAEQYGREWARELNLEFFDRKALILGSGV